MLVLCTVGIVAIMAVKLWKDAQYSSPCGCGNVNCPASCICRNSDHRHGHLL